MLPMKKNIMKRMAKITMMGMCIIIAGIVGKKENQGGKRY